ncbi:MAG: alanine--glyoxylate aminotransferase family protein [Candidatus Omnitrophica bacterium]|nr:alanine--glyoxylate aminotransferase family protein [Candidatus Omnitrophota bacterium]
MNKTYLLTPGPTPLPPEVREALSREIIHHRTKAFQEILGECLNDLKEIFKTKNDIFILTSSGTGAMEAAVVNLLSRGDKALCVQGGKFGERWTEICQAYGVDAEIVDVQWGEAVDPQVIEEKLKANEDIKAVFTTLCETSTATSSDIKAIGSIVGNHKCVLVVDAISALGAVDLETDEWGVDVVVCGSQKGLMLSPGLAFISMSPKAYSLMESSDLSRYYFDLRKAKKIVDKPDTPFTPAVSLVVALKEALSLMKKEGLEQRFKRFSLYREALKKAAVALGLSIFSRSPSDAVTAINLPPDIDGVKLVKIMRDTYGVGIAGGQGKLKGKIIRIAHMGYINARDIITAISALEDTLKDMGYKFQIGAGIKAAKEILKETR